MPTPTSSLTDDKPPSPCNEPLRPKSQGRKRGLFPGTPWQAPVFAGGSAMFWDATSTFQLITAAGIILQLPTWVPVLTNLKSGGRCRSCRAGSLFLHHWQPSIHSVPGSHTLSAAFSETCLLLKYSHHRAHWNDVSCTAFWVTVLLVNTN